MAHLSDDRACDRAWSGEQREGFRSSFDGSWLDSPWTIPDSFLSDEDEQGRSIEQVVERLRAYMPGWKAYFGLAQTPKVFRELDEWLRHRLRALHLKHWKRGTTIYPTLRRMGASPGDARAVAANSRRWWINSRYRLNRALPIGYFDRLGVPKLS